MRQKLQLVGKRFGALYILSNAAVQKGRSRFNARCTCGKNFVVFGQNLTSGRTKSCGCLKSKDAFNVYMKKREKLENEQ